MDAISRLTAVFLLNSLWQIALVTGVAMLLDRWLRAAPARYRHGLWVMTLAAAVVLPAMSTPVTAAHESAVSAQADIPLTITEPALTTVQLPGTVRTTTRTAVLMREGLRHLWRGVHFGIRIPLRLARVVVVLYLCFLLLMLVRFARAWLRTRDIRRQAFAAPYESVPAREEDSPLAIRRSSLAASLAAATVQARASILWSSGIAGPVTVGARRPAIILPSPLLETASGDDLKAALAHEMAHVRRQDYACNFICEVLLLPVAFHPLISIIKRRLSETRELACDELAASAINPESYARSLVRMAHDISGLALPAATRPDYTLGVFDADILEERVMRLIKPRASMRLAKCSVFCAALCIAASCLAAASFSLAAAQAGQTGETNQVSSAPPGAVAGAVTGGVQGGVVGGAVAGVPGGVQGGVSHGTSGGVSGLASTKAIGGTIASSPRASSARVGGEVVSATPSAGTYKYAGKVYAYDRQASEEKAGSLSGVVVDYNGTRITKAKVRLISRNTSFQQSTEADETGNFSFDNVPAGRYSLQVASPGMGEADRSFEFKAEGEPPFFPFVLHPGNMTEYAVVMAKPPADLVKAAAVDSRKIRVGGDVEAAKIVEGSHTSPQYPESARAKGIEGLVRIEATISADGVPMELKVVSSPDESLSRAALDAVRQWRYQPTLLNGDPVEVLTTISVDFRLQN